MEQDKLPVIRLWNHILVPLQGDIHDGLASRLRDKVLEDIRAFGAHGLIIDVTGVWTLDSHLCAVLTDIAACARLMGTLTIICGMSAEAAMTLQMMDIDMRSMKTALSVEEAFESLGVRPQKPAPAPQQRKLVFQIKPMPKGERR